MVAQSSLHRNSPILSILNLMLLPLLTILLASPPAFSYFPVRTCCPPPRLLVIEDVQNSRQRPNGSWVSDEIEEERLANPRHRRITNMSCVRDQNQLSNIDGFCWENFANIYSDDPFAPLAQSMIASGGPRFTPRSEVQKMACMGLTRDKKLQTVGTWFPTCSGGDLELTTRVLDINQDYMTGIFHIGEGGWLLEDRMNVTQEFCLTWDWDPR